LGFSFGEEVNFLCKRKVRRGGFVQTPMVAMTASIGNTGKYSDDEHGKREPQGLLCVGISQLKKG